MYVPVTDKTAIKISLRSFEDSYFYTEDRLSTLKTYLQGQRAVQGDLAVKVSHKSHESHTMYKIYKIKRTMMMP